MGYKTDIGYIPTSALLLFLNFIPKDTLGIYPLWGCLVDESRPDNSIYPNPNIFPVIIERVLEKDIIEDILNPRGWNEVYIKADAVDIKINGITKSKFI